MPGKAADLATRFWSKVEICPHGMSCAQCCWEWQGARDRDQYGRFDLAWKSIRRKASKTPAHRFMWQQQHGAIPPGLYVCHHCDHPPCVNPHHLYVGSNSDNQLDAIRKGRRPPGLPPGGGGIAKGEIHGMAKFTNNDILAMRKAWQEGATIKGLARLYKVYPSTIRKIVTYRNWGHLP